MTRIFHRLGKGFEGSTHQVSPHGGSHALHVAPGRPIGHRNAGLLHRPRDIIRLDPAAQRKTRCKVHIRLQPRIRQSTQGRQARLDRRRPRFDRPPSLLIQRGYAHPHAHRLEPGQKIEVAHHERITRQDAKRPPGPQEEFQAAPRDPVRPLHRLVGVRRGGQEHLAHLFAFQLPRQQRRQVALDRHVTPPPLALHVRHVRHVTIGARMTATGIGVQTPRIAVDLTLRQRGLRLQFLHHETAAALAGQSRPGARTTQKRVQSRLGRPVRP